MATRTPPAKAPGKNGFKYQPKYGVIVLCTDEAHQEAVYNHLKEGGHKCRVVTV